MTQRKYHDTNVVAKFRVTLEATSDVSSELTLRRNALSGHLEEMTASFGLHERAHERLQRVTNLTRARQRLVLNASAFNKAIKLLGNWCGHRAFEVSGPQTPAAGSNHMLPLASDVNALLQRYYSTRAVGMRPFDRECDSKGVIGRRHCSRELKLGSVGPFVALDAT